MSSQNEAALGSDSLQLSYGLQGGLLAIAIVASVSFVSSTILFLYLGYKLLWHYYTKPRGRISEDRFPSDNAQEAALGIDGIFDGPDHDNHQSHKRRDMSARRWAARDWKPPNQFLVLIFNLLLADMHQALAFLLNVEWLHKRAILVDTPSCFVQGIFISTGDLASSSFITFIAIHAYMSVVQRRLMPRRLLYAMVVCVWAFVYSISLIPIAATLNGARYDGFFVRAGAWCWINDSYELLRLLTHYIFIILALVATACLYLAIFASIRRRQALTDQTSHLPSDVQSQLQMSRNPVFLIYPVIYILCTLPLALGRVASVAGAAVPLGYMCFAGAMIAANGMFDCILFSTTRKAILFADKCDISLQETGLQTFAFMQTPKTRRYGNMVWIQGGQGAQTGWGPAKDEEATNGPWSRRNRGYPSKGYQRTESPRVSQERLRGRPAIQMDTVTSVVVEDDHDKDTDGGYTNQSAGSSIMEEPRASHHSL